MTQLKAAQVSRSGRTARTWNSETDEVQLYTVKESIRLKFSLNSKGGGVTDVLIAIGSEDFSSLISAMATIDRARAMQAMATILAREIAKQPEHDKEIIQDARESVVQAASDAFQNAPQGRDHAERLTRDMVRELVDQLNAADEAESLKPVDAA